MVPSGTRSYQYDANVNVIRATDRDGRVTTYAYNRLNEKVREQWVNGGSVLRTLNYAYDAVGNLTSAADTVGLGRDHNQYGFSLWMAGTGLRSAMAYGQTDEFGCKSVQNRVHWNDFHATVLHLLGIDHQRLTFYHNGIRRRLTNVHGVVLKDLLA